MPSIGVSMQDEAVEDTRFVVSSRIMLSNIAKIKILTDRFHAVFYIFQYCEIVQKSIYPNFNPIIFMIN